MNTYNLSQEEEIFVSSIRRGYHARSFIKEIVNSRKYDPTIDFNKYFVQVTDGILMDKSDFRGDVDNTFLGAQIGENIAFGEINYLTDQLKKEIDSKIVDKNLLDYETLVNELKSLPEGFNPKNLLIPIDHYIEFYNVFTTKAKIEYDKSETAISVENIKLKIFWSNRYMDFKEIYLLGEGAVEWIFKQSNQMKEVISDKVRYNYYDKSVDDIDIFYGLHPEYKIHFGVRTVACANINKGKVRIYKIDK